MGSERECRPLLAGGSWPSEGLEGANVCPLELPTGPMSRLKKRQDFVRLSKTGRRVAMRHLSLQVAPVPPGVTVSSEPRVGLTASRRVGGAVQRNRARRRLYSLAEQVINLYARPDQDYVLIARREILTASFGELKLELERALKRLNFLRRTSGNR